MSAGADGIDDNDDADMIRDCAFSWLEFGGGGRKGSKLGGKRDEARG